MKKVIIYTTIITFIGILPSLLQYGIFLPTADFSLQQIPFILETQKMLSSGVPFWSWNTYFGDNFIGAYSFYTLTSPFVWLNCLIPSSYVLEGLTFTLFLKLICTGIFSFLYLKKMNISKALCQAGALLYVFSSFTISTLGYYHFLEPLMCFPLFLIAIENYLYHKKYADLWLALTSFLIAFINFYFLPCSLFAGILYYCCRLSAKDIHFSWQRFAYATLLVTLGIGLSTFILLPTFFYLSETPRATAQFSLTHLFYSIDRIRTLFIPKIIEGHNNFLIGTGYGSNAVSLSVVGCLVALLYVIRHRDWLSKLCILSIIIYLTPLNGIFSLFTDPSYTRWGYALSLFLILATVKYIDEKLPIRPKDIILYGIACTLYLIIIYSIGYHFYHTHIHFESYDYRINIIIVGLFLFSLLCLYLYTKYGSPQTFIHYIAFFTAIYFSIYIFNRTDFKVFLDTNRLKSAFTIEKLNYSFVNRYILHNQLKRIPNNQSFTYRSNFITKNDNIYANLGLLKNRPSIQSYNSNQNNIIRPLFNAADSILKEKRNTFIPTCNIPSFQTLMSVKYIFQYNDPEQFTPSLGKLLHPIQEIGYTRYENPYYIPMGFTYTHYIDEHIVDSLNLITPKKDIPLLLLNYLAVPSASIPIVSKYLKQGNLAHQQPLDSVVTQRKKYVCQSFEGNTQGFTARIHLPKENIVFFSVPADKGFKAFVDRQPAHIYTVNLGLMGIIVPQGQHTIQCIYRPRGLYLGGLISLISLIALFSLVFYNNRQKSVPL